MLDRASQNLPVPVGSFRPVHRPVWAFQRLWWRHREKALATAGVAAGVIGVLLVIAAPAMAVFEQGDVIHIGSDVLRRVPAAKPGVELYEGSATLVLAFDGSVERSSAVATVNGRRVSGTCTTRVATGGNATEVCRFTFADGTTLTASDIYTASKRDWQRKYSDGSTAAYEVSGGQPVPIPLPLAHG